MKVISYLCWIFKKPTCSDKGKERGTFTAASLRHQGTLPRLLKPQHLLPRVPSSCYSPALMAPGIPCICLRGPTGLSGQFYR